MMAALRLAGFELRRFRGRMRLLGLAFLVIVPSLYGSLYLWSNWDTYGELDRIPVAVVNDDKPVTVEGERVDAGSEFVDQLRSQPFLGWRFTDAEDARDGLAEGRYYFVITVPEDFSARLTSAAMGTPQRAELQIRLDDANGYIVGIMAETAESEIRAQVNAAAYSAYAETALGDLNQLRKGLVEAGDGADELAKGAKGLQTGAKELHDGLGKLDSGAADLESGAKQVADGTRELQGAVNAADTAISGALDRLEAFDTAGNDLSDQLEALADDNPDLADDPAFEALQQAADDLDERLDSATGDARGDAQQLVDEIDQLADGAAQVASGSEELHDGIGDAEEGAAELQKGAKQLHTGADELAGRLDDAAQRVPPTDAKERAKMAETLSEPVAIKVSNANPAGEYGRGLAPFFISIALWVFGLVAYLMLRPVAGEAVASRLPAWSVAVGAWLPAAILGAAGAVVLYLVVDIGLGLDPVEPLGMIGMMLLAVAAFTAIDHFLRLTFGVIGDALSLVLLVLQLAAAGGLYPIETAPGLLRAINPLLPMTYSIDAFRILISGGQSSHLWRDVAVLAGLLVVMLALTTWTVARQRVWTLTRLKPELEI
jgi:putative membrane protein